jgi:Tol biopolymer transport system component
MADRWIIQEMVSPGRFFLVAVVVVTVAGSASAVGSSLDDIGAPGRFLFLTDQATPNLSQIYVAGSDESGFRKLTSSARAEWDPAWSPDGSKVAFGRAVGCSATLGSCSELWTVNADGTGERRLTSAARMGRARPISAIEPTWSPDGRRIAYVQILEKSEATSLRVMAADGSNDRPLLLGDVSAPAWSPDGTRIAFCRGGYTRDDIFMLKLGQSRPHRVAKTALSECEPDWSPDGRRIAFEGVDASGPGPLVQYDVYVMSATGKNRRRLTRNRALDGNPVWSPDGTQIAFVSDRAGDPAIYVVQADRAGQQRKLTTPSLDDYAIDWAAAKH